MNSFILNNYVEVLKKYADFNGRANRAEFWWFFLANLIAIAVVGLVSAVIRIPALIPLYFLAILLPNIAVGIRRLRDAGYTPLLLLLALTGIGAIVLLVLWAMPSKR